MPLSVRPLAIPEVRLIVPDRFRDERGYFSETYSRRDFAAAGIDDEFVQDNHSLSTRSGTVRGLHYQLAPFAQAKLVRVARGAMLDVAVDLRRGSPTFGRHVAQTLSAALWSQLFVPVGFAHGFCTLEPDTEVVYKVTAPYSRAHDRGVRWDDSAFAIPWPIAAGEAILSEKDRALPLLRDLGDEELFAWSDGTA
jgi:dTDP-4-dehydrorhamnose 3,5-epimerase